MVSVFSIMMGGAIGAWLRYALGVRLSKSAMLTRLGIPSAILIINGIGSLLLGWGIAFWEEGGNGGFASLIAGWTIGFCGSLTTFSTFGMEMIELLRKKRKAAAFAYLTATLLLSFIGFLIGYNLGN
jgi:CrcB protein